MMALAISAFVAFMVIGNLAILGAWKWEAAEQPASAATPTVDVTNFRVVDDHLWRGGAPDERGYESLAANGVTTVVDLRAEDDLDVPVSLLHQLDLRLVRIPMRDGQAPTRAQVARFLAVMSKNDGPVFVHCGAGVGRTGTMAASYLVATGQATAVGALRANLGVGPPSLEQLAFAAELHGHDVDRPPAVVVAASRVLDAPRRIWSSLR
jgi:protein-tyrosine phosphatase